MRIVALSDTHNAHELLAPLPEGDVLIHAGDMTGRGSQRELLDFGLWFEEQKDKFKHRILVAGNHDLGLDSEHGAELARLCFDKDVICLNGHYVVLDGIMFYGSPYTPMFNNWAFMKDDFELAKEWTDIPEEVDILITHGPAFGILDKNQEGDCCGSVSLYNRIANELPELKHHIFGHIHEQGGKTEIIDNVQFHNVSCMNRQYQLVNKPTIIEV